MSTSTETLASTLVEQFQHMARRDGGELSLLGVADDTIRVGYRPGADPDCDDGSCVLPHVELGAMMRESARRRDPGIDVLVEMLP